MPQRRQRRSRRQEEAGAESLGGRRVAGSGSGWAVKNDVRTDDLSVEYKYTDKKSFPLRRDDLQKAQHHALLDSGREFAFIVGFGQTTAGSAFSSEEEYVVISRPYFESLRNHGHSE